MSVTWIEELVVPDVCPSCGDWSVLFEVYIDNKLVWLGCEHCTEKRGYETT